MSEATRLQKFVGQANAFLLPLYLDFLDCKIAHYDSTADPARPEYNEHGIITFWHEYIVAAIPGWGNTSVTALCSQHRDGEWVNQTAISLAMNVVRGSSSRGGSAAIRQIKKNGKFSSIVITPDGPRGPRREMATGSVFMASLLGLPIIPVGIGMSNPIRLNTWDRFAIPRPTSRVRMIAGPKVRVPKRLGKEQLESTRQSVERLLEDLCDEAEDWAISGRDLKGQRPFQRVRRKKRLWFNKTEPHSAKQPLMRGIK